MKLRHILLSLTVLAVASFSLRGQTAGDAPVITQSSIDSVSYLLGVNFGSVVKGSNFGELNLSEMKRGFDDFLKAKGSPMDEKFSSQFSIDPNDTKEVINSFLEKRMRLLAAENSVKEREYLDKTASSGKYTKTSTGLLYRIVKPGNSTHPTAKDDVSVSYKGMFTDGSVFDEVPENEPVDFNLGRVIYGWTEGLQLIGEDGIIELVIPSSMAYGERGNAAIGPCTPLLFSVHLHKVLK